MRTAALFVLLAVAGCHADAAPSGHGSPELIDALQLPDHCNAAVTSDDGRVFVNFPHPDGDVGVKIAEVKDGHTVVPYPDVTWNTYDPGKGTDDAAHKFVGTNSIRFGPDGNLWVVDTGVTTPGGKPVVGGPKLVAIDVKSNAVVRTIPLGSMLRDDSFVDDVRFQAYTFDAIPSHGPYAFLTDAGHPALIVLDLANGQGRRVLEDDPSTTARRSMRGGGTELVRFTGGPVKLHADQLELSPDNQTLYFQPCPGPMSTVPTALLVNPATPPEKLAAAVRPFYDTPTLGGTCIDADGNIYLDDADHRRIDRLTPAGERTTVVPADDRLDWGDAMWIAANGDLWVPAAQQDTAAVFHAGVSALHLPVHVYRLPLGLKPLRN